MRYTWSVVFFCCNVRETCICELNIKIWIHWCWRKVGEEEKKLKKNFFEDKKKRKEFNIWKTKTSARWFLFFEASIQREGYLNQGYNTRETNNKENKMKIFVFILGISLIYSVSSQGFIPPFRPVSKNPAI